MLLVGSGAAVAMMLVVGGDDDDGGVAAPAEDGGGAATPVEAVTSLYEALRQGDCSTVDALRTGALQEMVESSDQGTCSELADWITEDPEHAEEVLPPVGQVEERYRSEAAAIVDVTFDVRGEKHDRFRRIYTVRQSEGTWKIGTREEAEQADPDSVELNADMMVFLDPDVTAAQRTAIEDVIAAHQDVVTYGYLDRELSLDEARRLFQTNEEMLDYIEAHPEEFPTSFRLVLTSIDAATIDPLAYTLRQQPGVVRVTDIREWSALADSFV